MGKYFDGEAQFIYLDQFAVSRIFAISPPQEWIEVAALIKQGIINSKLIYANSIEQMIETSGMDKSSAQVLDSEARNFSSNWCFLSEQNITANYLICHIREITMTKYHFIHKHNQKAMIEPGVYEGLNDHNSTSREIVVDVNETVNALRKAAQGTPGEKPVRDDVVRFVKEKYLEDLITRMYALGTQGSYMPRQQIGHGILYWADVLCSNLTNDYHLTQPEALNAFKAFKESGIDVIPTLSIRASLEAMIAYRSIQETPNDVIDVMRIAGALQFSDIMLIDGAKVNDVRELQLDKKYKTKVYSGNDTDLENLKKQLKVIVANC